GRALDIDPAGVGPNDRERDREAEAGAAGMAVTSTLRAVEALEEVRQVLVVDALAGVLDVDPGAGDIVDRVDILANPQIHRSLGRRMADRVVEQDEHHLNQLVAAAMQ